MFTEEKEVDKVEVVTSFNLIQVRTATIVKKNGEEVARSYHRHLVQPGQDLSGEDPKVVAIANAVHTPEIIAAFEEKRAADLAAAGIPV
jgi:ABC-type lipoprotein export system ATPase subunit